MMKVKQLFFGFFLITTLCCVFVLYQPDIFHSFVDWMKYTKPTQNNLQKEYDFRLDFTYENITKFISDDKLYHKTINKIKDKDMNSQSLSAEAFNSSSPYYGLFYKNMYGKSLGKVRQTLFKKINQNWKLIFPNLILSLQKQQQFNPSLNISLYTSAASIVIKNTCFNLGDEFTATIFSIDGRGRPKTFGGDYYRARLVRGNGTYPDGIPCRVIDNLDGSYTVKAPLLFEGTLTLIVILVLPVEGIRDAIEETSRYTCDLEGFKARLESNETVVCRFIGRCFKNDILCDYSNPFNKAVWVCQSPQSGKCSPIEYMYFDKKKSIKSPIWGVCKQYYCNTKLETATLSVKHNHSRTDKHSNLPQCKTVFNNQITSDMFIKISGFFYGGYWRSTVCESKTLQWPIHNLNACLHNKVIYMFGDSTIRQFFKFTMNRLKLKRYGEDDSKVWQRPSIAYHNNTHQQNTTIYYRANGPPLANPGPPSSRPYIADSIAGLIGGRNVFVVFNLGAHFYNYDPSVFVHRLKGIRHAIELHHKLFPETKFLLRGLNVIDTLKLRHEWFAYRLEIILRSMFTNMNNLVYLNFWDVTTVWPLDNNVHPPPKVLEQEAYLMFSYMC